MDREEIIWAAGFFEGEGWISIQKNTPACGIQNTDKECLRRFQVAVGLGNIYHRPPRIYSYEKIKTRKTQWAWRVSGFENTQAVLAMLWQWLSARRKVRAKEVLAVARNAKGRRAKRDRVTAA